MEEISGVLICKRAKLSKVDLMRLVDAHDEPAEGKFRFLEQEAREGLAEDGGDYDPRLGEELKTRLTEKASKLAKNSTAHRTLQ